MFWDQETKEYVDYGVDKSLTYRILDTVFDRLSKKTWIKLDSNPRLANLIIKSKGRDENWELIEEINGGHYLWVTDKFLTLLQIQGARPEE